MRKLYSTAMLLLWTALSFGQETQCPMIHIETERLADLIIPRNAHAIFCVNGEMTVVGGHTTNFIPTSTAEYYKDGVWHLMETVYPHDNGINVLLKSGKVLLAGGHSEPLGVGQSFPVEEYDPATHSFRGFSSLSEKRSLAAGVELDSGHIVIAGNWYEDDCIELFDGDRTFSHVKDVTIGRASPYVIRSSHDNALILGNGGTHGEILHSEMVDCLKGKPLHVPLLRQWQPLFYEAPFCNNLGFIGDEAADDYSWLLPVQDCTVGENTDWLCSRPLAFLLVRDTVFSLLPTVCPAPVECQYGPIHYYSPVIADRQSHRGYVHGIDKQNRHYLLCIEYDKTPAPLTLYYTDPLPMAGFPEIALTDDGNFMIAGGITYNKGINGMLENDNFSPVSSVFLLHLNNSIVKPVSKGKIEWPLTLLILALLTALTIVFLFRKRHSKTTIPSGQSDAEISIPESEKAFMRRINDLMEQEKLYLNHELQLADVASRLGTNRNIVSRCINSQRGCSFSQFVSRYRVEHAKELIRRQPDVKISEVWMESGFSNESSFFCTFKAFTGVTPNEWKQKIADESSSAS